MRFLLVALTDPYLNWPDKLVDMDALSYRASSNNRSLQTVGLVNMGFSS